VYFHLKPHKWPPEIGVERNQDSENKKKKKFPPLISVLGHVGKHHTKQLFTRNNVRRTRRSSCLLLASIDTGVVCPKTASG